MTASSDGNSGKLIPGIGRMPYPAYTGDEPFIFVSYAHKNSEQVFREIIRLNELGYRVWYDEGIAAGNEWPDEIANALLKCSVFIVFMTPDAAGSRNVGNEIKLAIEEDKKLFSVYLSECKMPAGIRLQYGLKQDILKYQCTEEEYVYRLVKSLKRLGLEADRRNAGAAEPEEKKESEDARIKVITYSNGDVYEGEIRGGKRNGRGVLTYARGDVYEGEFEDDMFCGQGKLTYIDGSIYDGEWKDGKIEGRGVYTYPHTDEFEDPSSGSVRKVTYMRKYEGGFRNGKQEGSGILTLMLWDGRSRKQKDSEREYCRSGSTAVPNFIMGHEQTVITYNGEWKAGKEDGFGTVTIKPEHGFYKAVSFSCRWKDGKYIVDGPVLREQLDEIQKKWDIWFKPYK